MSRKFRLEEEKAKQLQEELQEEEDKLKAQKERIFGPMVWRRLPSGIKIMDLQSDNYVQVANIILEFYVKKNVVFRNATRFLEDEDSIRSFRDKLLISMMDRCSIIAVKEEAASEIDEEIVGVLLLKAVKQCDYGRIFSRVCLSSGKPYASIVKFMNMMSRKVDVFDEFNCDIYLRYYIMCIKPDYRGKLLGYQLMSTAIDIARHLNISVIMGVFDGWKLQDYAKKLGMQKFFEILYRKYHDEEEELIFCDLGAGNYTCAIMAGVIPPLPEPVPIKKVESLIKPRTRAEKRAKYSKNQ